MKKIFPSLIDGDILNLEKQIKKLEKHCEGFHIDVMDDNFVPNLTWGPKFVNAISRTTNKPLFVHLMVEKPEKWPHIININPSSTLCFHIENDINFKKLIAQIVEKKWHVGVAIKPKTSIKKLFPILNNINHVLLMSVEPGFSGQKFLKSSIEKLAELVDYRKKHKMNFTIFLDGGINQTKIQNLSNLGADSFAIGSAIFNSKNEIHTIQNLYEKINQNW